jgi:hypothetical protein
MIRDTGLDWSCLFSDPCKLPGTNEPELCDAIETTNINEISI